MASSCISFVEADLTVVSFVSGNRGEGSFISVIYHSPVLSQLYEMRPKAVFFSLKIDTQIYLSINVWKN